MNSQIPKEEAPATVQLENSQVVKFLIAASPEDLKSLEDTIKTWKTVNNKAFNKIGITSDLKDVPIIEIRNK